MRRFVLSLVFLLFLSTTATAYDVSYIQCFGEVVLLAGKGVPSEVAIFEAKTMKVIDIVTFKPEKNALIAVSKKPNYPTEIVIGPVPVVVVPTPTPTPAPTPTPVRSTTSGSTYQASGTTTYLSPNDPAITWRSATDKAKANFCAQAIERTRPELSHQQQLIEAYHLLLFMESSIGSSPYLDDVYASESLSGIAAIGLALRNAELNGEL